ncbi:MAG: helix-turn-helix domain-containing protein [Aristaeellaceae bacterium]
MSDNVKKNEYLQRVVKRIKKVMESRNINQTELIALAENHGYVLRQSTLSKILSDSASMSIVSIVQIANTLGIDLNDLFSESNSLEVRSYRDKPSTAVQTKLIRRADSQEMRPYLNSYHTYFFQTKSSDEGLLSGKLDFLPSDDKSRCIARFSFATGKQDIQNRPIKKEYEGELVISRNMSAAYCVLISEEIGEISYILFNYMPILYEELRCRVALVLTSSAGASRIPTVHRMIISREEISPEDLDMLKGQLYLNESEILISESGLERFLSDERLDPEFINYFCKPGQEAKFLGLSPVPYYQFDEAIIRSAFLDSKVKTDAINLIRQYSASPKYNKIGSKCDELVYKVLNHKQSEKVGN